MKTLDAIKTGENINAMRIAKGMTVRDIQDIFGFSTPQAVYKWIHGTNMPTIDNLVVLVDVFDTTLNEIIATK